MSRRWYSVFQPVVTVDDQGVVECSFGDSYQFTVTNQGTEVWDGGYGDRHPHAAMLDAILYGGKVAERAGEEPEWKAVMRLAKHMKKQAQQSA